MFNTCIVLTDRHINIHTYTFTHIYRQIHTFLQKFIFSLQDVTILVALRDYKNNIFTWPLFAQVVTWFLSVQNGWRQTASLVTCTAGWLAHSTRWQNQKCTVGRTAPHQPWEVERIQLSNQVHDAECKSCLYCRWERPPRAWHFVPWCLLGKRVV